MVIIFFLILLIFFVKIFFFDGIFQILEDEVIHVEYEPHKEKIGTFLKNDQLVKELTEKMLNTQMLGKSLSMEDVLNLLKGKIDRGDEIILNSFHKGIFILIYLVL